MASFVVSQGKLSRGGKRHLWVGETRAHVEERVSESASRLEGIASQDRRDDGRTDGCGDRVAAFATTTADNSAFPLFHLSLSVGIPAVKSPLLPWLLPSGERVSGVTLHSKA